MKMEKRDIRGGGGGFDVGHYRVHHHSVFIDLGGDVYDYVDVDNSPSSSALMVPGVATCTSPSPFVCNGLNYIEHHVSQTDTLAGVAIKYGVEVADIKKMNSLVTDLQMFALKTLHIPLPGRHPPSPYKDKDGDLKVGIKSTALRFGDSTKQWISGFGLLCIGNLALSGYSADIGWPYYAFLAAGSEHLAWQIWTLTYLLSMNVTKSLCQTSGSEQLYMQGFYVEELLHNG